MSAESAPQVPLTDLPATSFSRLINKALEPDPLPKWVENLKHDEMDTLPDSLKLMDLLDGHIKGGDPLISFREQLVRDGVPGRYVDPLIWRVTIRLHEPRVDGVLVMPPGLLTLGHLRNVSLEDLRKLDGFKQNTDAAVLKKLFPTPEPNETKLEVPSR